MKHVIIGTAGHVDHGKTLLIKALTGIDTDRLQEEKKRGITIELGFAHLTFEDGTRAGIVDVPGHEKFIKNMLAGAGGIDLAMLVVAADEGFMPQTVEHLGILSLLGVKDGLVVLTKTDLTEPDWLDLMTQDIRSRVQGTFLEGKPILPVSALTGEGIPELREQLRLLIASASEKDPRAPFRLPIDRVFSADGFGTVVTGTLIEGCIHQDDGVELFPSGLSARVRTLQVHGQEVDSACAGQRVAINLAGVKKADVQRGDIAAKPASLCPTLMLDVRLQNLKESHRVILSGSQVHLYHGCTAALCKVILLDRDELRPGESCYAQLRLTRPLCAKNGDRFVIRFYSPVETIGGGIVLDHAPPKHKRGRPQVLEALKVRESGSEEERIAQALARSGLELPDRPLLSDRLSLGEEQLEPVLQDMLVRGKVLEPLPGRFLSCAVLDSTWERGRPILESYHAANPLHEGMRKAELRQKLLPRCDRAVADALLTALTAEGKLRTVADRYALQDFRIRLTKRQASIRERLLELYRNADQSPPNLEEVWPLFPPKERDDCKKVLESLLSGGHLVMVDPKIVFHADACAAAAQTARAWFDTHETLTLGQFRDLMNTSRRYALALLEYFDRNRMTRKEGDLRRPGDRPFL